MEFQHQYTVPYPKVDRMEMLYLDKIQIFVIFWCPLKQNTSLLYQERLNTFFFLCLYIKYIKRCKQDDDERLKDIKYTTGLL